MNTEEAISNVKNCPILSTQTCENLINGTCGHCSLIKAYPSLYTALREKKARENLHPLTLEQLKKYDGKPIWLERKTIEPQYAIVSIGACGDEDLIALSIIGDVIYLRFSDYGKTWLAYDHKPEAKSLIDTTEIKDFPEYLDFRCCMCPNVDKDVTICPGIEGTPHTEPDTCRFVKAYVDEYGWEYRVMPSKTIQGLFVAHIRKTENKVNCTWSPSASLCWRKTFDEAQSDLNKRAKEKGWAEANG